MYKINCALSANREPWNLPLQERIRLTQTAQKEGKRNALLLYTRADTSTFRYRGYNVMQATRRSQNWQCVYFFLDELSTLEQLLANADLLIFCRLQWVHALAGLKRKAQSLHIPVLFDVDDLVFDLDYLPLVTNTLNVSFSEETDYTYWFSYISRIGYTAALADGFFTTNDFLGKKLSEKFGKPYQIVRNSLNEEQLAVSAECLRRKKMKSSQKPFTLGYFSGTPSHINDFRTIYRELMQFLSDYPDTVLQVVGFMEFPPAMQPLIEAKRVTFTPLVDFMELQRLTAQVDVNLVPLVCNTFTNCKSELKYFEAAVVGTPTVAAPNYTYAHAIQNRKTGFLCQPGQWYDAVRRLYEHPEEGAAMAEAARNACLAVYAGDAFTAEVERAYDFFAAP